ncbi:MAG: carboxypeptidase-like regulatory domain-containing protein [Thermoplasmata archaeon]|nr:carboxypeptidase-like regulatory domain-containing protein [Thermoplasmata archaeon]
MIRSAGSLSQNCPGSYGGSGASVPNCPDPGPLPDGRPASGGTLFAWSQLNDLLPVNVSGAGLASDSPLGEAVQFGGTTASGLSNPTQLYSESGDQWGTLDYGACGCVPPSPRTEFGFAGDPAAGIAVLFGGNVGGPPATDANDTWSFNFTNYVWQNVSLSVAPAPRQDPAFAVDPTAGLALLFGGWDPDYQGSGQVIYSDTWELNLTTDVWTRVASLSGVSPPALYGARLDWDPSSGTFDLFGGCYPCSNTLWQFNPSDSSWSEVTSPNGPVPSPRMEGVWVYDPGLEADLLYGGTNGFSSFSDLSIYLPSDNSWAVEATPLTPAARSEASADWLDVAGNSTLLMTGGSNGNMTFGGTWRLALSANAVVVVENLSTGAPITDAFVGSNLGGTLSTNAEGDAEFFGLPSAELVVNVTAPGYAQAVSAQWVPPGVTSTIIMSLKWIASATVDTFVTEGGAPVEGARVNLSIEGAPVGSPGITDPAGWSNATGVPAFEGVVTAWYPGQHPNSTRVDFVSNGVTIVRISLVPLLELNVFVEGLLPNATMAPLLNATVTVNDYFVGLTDASGHAQESTSYQGREIVGASASYFAPNSTLATLPTTGVLDLTIVLTSAPPGYLDVDVLDSQTFAPVPGAHLNFTQTPVLPVGPPTFDRIAAGGTLLITLLAGNYTLVAWATGYATDLGIPLQWIRPGQIDPLTVYLTPLPRAVLDTLVLDNATHRPISGANVSVEGFENMTTDAGGWANFTALAAGAYTLVASAPGYDTNVSGIVLNPGQVIDRYPINLTRAGSPSGPGGANDLSLLPPGTGSIWALLLLPLGALALAVIYLTMLRAPESTPAAGPDASERPPRRSDDTRRRRWFHRSAPETPLGPTH